MDATWVASGPDSRDGEANERPHRSKSIASPRRRVESMSELTNQSVNGDFAVPAASAASLSANRSDWIAAYNERYHYSSNDTD